MNEKKFDYDIRSVFKKIKITAIMSDSGSVVNENDNLSEVEDVFIMENLTHVCIVDNQENFTGIISQKYLYKVRSPQKILPGRIMEKNKDIIIDSGYFYDRHTLNGYILKDVMDKTTDTLHPENSLADALLLMARIGASFIPIIDEKYKIKGVLKESNIIKMLAELSA